MQALLDFQKSAMKLVRGDLDIDFDASKGLDDFEVNDILSDAVVPITDALKPLEKATKVSPKSLLKKVRS